MATVAFDQRSAVQLTMTVVAAGRAAIPVWPTHLVHRLLALLFGSEFIEELLQTHAFLKLNGIFAHVVTPYLFDSYDFMTRSSQCLRIMDNQVIL